MFKLSFFIFLNFVFLDLSVTRIILKYKKKYHITASALTKIGTITLIYQLVSLYFYKQSGWLIFLSLNFSIILLHFMLSFEKRRIEKCFEKDFSLFLNNIILQMQVGQGFRSAFHASKKHFSHSFINKADKILEYVVFSQQKSILDQEKWLEEAIEEFRCVDNEAFNGLIRIKSFYDKIKLEKDFRRRSGQITLQIRAQITVMTVLYALLFILNNIFFKQNVADTSILISVLLYFLGLLAIFRIQKGFRWKV